MNRYLLILPATVAAATVLLSSPPGAMAAGPADTWGTARELPGSAALNADGAAAITSVSCSSPGNCGGGGYYTDSSGHRQAMVATEVNGTWGKAEEVPGSATLNVGGGAAVTSVSCAGTGDCAVGGSYSDSAAHGQAFVVSETGGTWGMAAEVPGTGALNVNGDARVSAVSCAAPGECSLGGDYVDGSGHFQAFVDSEAGGTWGAALEVPGSAKLNTAGDAVINSLSCAASGECSAGGYYSEYSGNISLTQAFVVSQAGGSWGNMKEVPGTATLNTGGLAAVDALSCSAIGDCSAGGSYDDSSGHYHAFVVSEVSGTWGRAVQAPGTATLDKGGVIALNALSCGSPGNCDAGGYYADSAGHYQAFVASQASGTWAKAKEVPGTATLNQGIFAEVSTLSCDSSGDCGLAGYYTDSAGHYQAFVASESGGTWAKAEEIPGTGSLNKGGTAQAGSISCPAADGCGAGGYYTDSSGRQQAFVASQS